jgi:ABC-type hemin transport system ATPase subunit
MKAQIIITDEQGHIFEGNAELVRVSKSAKAPKAAAKTRAALRPATDLSFSLNVLAFMKKFAKGMSGSRKFTLLLAHLVKGKTGQEISGERIASAWNRMKQVLGGAYNAVHATRAKAEGWIDSPKWGHYALSNSWREAASDT